MNTTERKKNKTKKNKLQTQNKIKIEYDMIKIKKCLNERFYPCVIQYPY